MTAVQSRRGVRHLVKFRVCEPRRDTLSQDAAAATLCPTTLSSSPDATLAQRSNPEGDSVMALRGKLP
jgi:hypothetical protein